MKEQIYTIPVNDGFDAETECPFCAMFEKLEQDALNYTLGPSYMEQDVRDKTNAVGFCTEHYRMMYDSQNRLGLALMVSTHMAEISNRMKKLMAEKNSAPKRGILRRSNEKSTLAEYVKGLEHSCFVCDKINASMDRYFDTFFYLWRKEPEFKQKVLKSKGFCLSHFEKLVTMSGEKLSAADCQEFLEAVTTIQDENFERVRQELLWFISKFDYRFKDKPWGNSKDSLHRAIIKAASYNLEKKQDVK